MTYLENIAKQNITQSVVDDIPRNTFTTEETRNNAKRKNVFQHPQAVVAMND